MWSSSQPERIFTVTGSDVAPAVALTTAATPAGSRIMALPSPLPVIFGAGQPKLMSMNWKPAPSNCRAAAAMYSGSLPKSWSPATPSPGSRFRMSRAFWFFPFENIQPLADSISLTAQPAPCSWHKSRIAASVTPAIGASPANALVVSSFISNIPGLLTASM